MNKYLPGGRGLFDEINAVLEMLLQVFKRGVKNIDDFVLEFLQHHINYKIINYTWEEGLEASCYLKDVSDTLYVLY